MRTESNCPSATDHWRQLRSTFLNASLKIFLDLSTRNLTWIPELHLPWGYTPEFTVVWFCHYIGKNHLFLLWVMHHFELPLLHVESVQLWKYDPDDIMGMPIFWSWHCDPDCIVNMSIPWNKVLGKFYQLLLLLMVLCGLRTGDQCIHIIGTQFCFVSSASASLSHCCWQWSTLLVLSLSLFHFSLHQRMIVSLDMLSYSVF